MSLMRLNPNNVEVSVKRLGLNGLTVDLAQVVEVETDGVLLLGEATRSVAGTTAPVQVRKNAALVTLNPAVVDILRGMPGYPTLLSEGFYGSVELTYPDLTDDQLEAMQELPWLVKLSLVPVGLAD